MRAKQAQMQAMTGHATSAEALLEQEVAKARGQVTTSVSDAAIERSARVEIQQSMDKSESGVRHALAQRLRVTRVTIPQNE